MIIEKSYDAKLHVVMSNPRIWFKSCDSCLSAISSVQAKIHGILSVSSLSSSCLLLETRLHVFIYFLKIQNVLCHLTVQHIKLLKILAAWHHVSETWCALLEHWEGRAPLRSVSFVLPRFFNPGHLFFFLSWIPVIILDVKQISVDRYFIQIRRADWVKKSIWTIFI